MMESFIVSDIKKTEPDRTIIEFSESINLNHLNLMKDWVSKDLQKSELWLIIDLKNVKFLYSQLINVLFLASKNIKKNNGKLGFINTSVIIQQSFKAMGLQSLVDIGESEDVLIDLWTQ